MKPFVRVTSHAAVLDRADVDTDQIIPKQFLKRIERTGYGEFLFHDWRRDDDFELHSWEETSPRILVAGRNFGCGSSREHAPWALQDFGFEAIVAPSFGDIFSSNCAKIGLAAIALPAEQVRVLMEHDGEITVDLEAQTVSAGASSFPFTFDPFARHCLLNGLDDIALTLEHEDAISVYEAGHDGAVDTLALP